MVHNREDIMDIELESGSVFRSFINHQVAEGDIQANRFGVRLWKGKAPVTLTAATVMGYFIRADGTTVVINGGSQTGQVFTITLPAACFAVQGNFTLAIKVVSGGVTGTMRIIDGTVVDTTIGTIVDPGSAVPDLSSLMAVIERAETAAAKINAITISTEQIKGTRYRIIVNKI